MAAELLEGFSLKQMWEMFKENHFAIMQNGGVGGGISKSSLLRSWTSKYFGFFKLIFNNGTIFRTVGDSFFRANRLPLYI